MRPHRGDLHTLTGCYALDAVDGVEHDRFERHLRRCQACEAEVRGLRETAAQLALAAAVTAPEGLRRRVLAAVHRTRQLPPVVPARVRGTGPVPGRSWRLRLPVAVAATSLAAVAALAVAETVTVHQLDATRAREAAVAAVLTAPDARISSRHTSAGGTVTAVVDARHHRMVVLATDLPRLPTSRVYELWLMKGTAARPAGLLRPSASGHTPPILATAVTSGDELGITIEPGGGTTHPTTTPILTMPLSG